MAPEETAPPAQPLLRARGLLCSYGDRRVLNGVDFDVWPGQLVALTGENGAGKSTLVRCIAGDTRPRSAARCSWTGSGSRRTPAPPATGWPSSGRTLPSATTSTWRPTSSWGASGPVVRLRRQGERRREAHPVVVRHLGERRPAGLGALQRPAPTGRRRPGHAEPAASSRPRRADGVARRARDPPGRRADRQAEAPKARRSSSSPTTSSRCSTWPTGSSCSTAARWRPTWCPRRPTPTTSWRSCPATPPTPPPATS